VVVAGIVHPAEQRADARLGAVPEPSHPAHERVRAAAERRGVSIEIVTFDDSTHTAQEAADAIGVDLGQIVKSLVFVAPVDLARDDAGWEPIIALVRGTDRVDIPRLASVTGKARMRRATAREAADASGFSIGGIPPFGHRQRISVVMDPALDAYPEVWAAAGTANAVFAIAPATLAKLSDALVAPCTEVGSPAADEP
jgi:prolyl-tRNA editing enzyme YbaK/EbsC (Cys-tRNA(Pro) deacylase)